MKPYLSLMALVACSLLASCSKDSTTILQGEKKSSELNEEQRQQKIVGDVLLEQEHLKGDFKSLMVKGKKPTVDSVDYYTVKEEILADKSRKIIVTALLLKINDSSAQDFFKRANNVSELIIIAEKIIIETAMNFPGTKIFIKADELQFAGNGKIVTTPEANQLLPAYGVNGSAGNNGGDLILDVQKLDLGEKGIRFVLDGGQGQSAGLGKDGLSGISVNPLYENVIKECTVAVTTCFEKELGEVESPPVTTCKGTDRIPTNGSNALPPGAPGIGGKGGDIYFSLNTDISKAISQSAGRVGLAAPAVKGGDAGSPQTAVLRTIHTRRSRGSCNPGGGGRPGRLNTTINLVTNQVLAQTAKGADSASKTIVNTAKVGQDMLVIQASKIDEDSVYFDNSNYRKLKLEFAKDLYRNNYFNEAREALKSALDRIHTVAIEDRLIKDEATLLLNQLNSNKDFYGYDFDKAPVVSFEASMMIYNQNVKTSLDTMVFVSSMKKSVDSSARKIEKMLEERDLLREQMFIAAQNHSTAYKMIPSFEAKLAKLEDARQALAESLARVEAQIEAEAKSNIHSAEKKKKLIKGLKLVATLASVSPLGAPASQVIGKSLDAMIDLSQNSETGWQDVVKESYGAYSNLKKVDWNASKKDWNEKYKTLDTDLFISNKKFDRKKAEAYLENLLEKSGPLTSKINEYYKSTYAQKVPSSQYEAEVERIKSIHPEFKTLVGKLNELQKQKEEVDSMLASINNSLVQSETSIANDFLMITDLEHKEENLKDGLNFDIDHVLNSMDNSARNRLMKYKGHLIKAYTYRTLMPYPGHLDLENINRQLEAFAKVDGMELTSEDLKRIYDEDVANIGYALMEHIQNGNFKEYESEYSVDLSEKELSALVEGKTIYLDLTKESALFESKDNVRVINVGVEDFQGSGAGNQNVEILIRHTGTSILTRGGNDYFFRYNSDSSAATWISKLNMKNETAVLVKESDNNTGLLESILGSELGQNSSPFSPVGAKALFAVKLDRAEGLKFETMRLKINFSYSLKN